MRDLPAVTSPQDTCLSDTGVPGMLKEEPMGFNRNKGFYLRVDTRTLRTEAAETASDTLTDG